MKPTFSLGLPTQTADWTLTIRTVRLVLSMPSYTVHSLIYAALALSVFVLSRNTNLLRKVMLSERLPLEARLRVFIELYPGIGTAYTTVQTGALVATATVVGINLGVATYHFREHRVSLGQGSGSLAGIVLGTFGAGCAACGSAILAGLLSMVGASGLLLALPLDGLEFTGLAMGALLLSLYWLADGMRGGEIAGCPVDPQSDERA